MYLASISTDLKIYNCEGWNVQFNIGNGAETLKSIKWSDDARYIAQIGSKTGVEIFSVTEESTRSVQHVPINDATSAAFQKGGARNLAIGTKCGKTHIWDTKLNNTIKTYSTTTSPVKLLDFNTKNTYLAAALENGDIGIYGITTNNLLGIINVPHSKSISSLRFHKEFRSILGVATDDGSILLKDLSSGKDRMFLNNAHAAPITGLSFSPINKDVLLSCSLDKKMHLHDIRLQTIVSTINSDKFLTCVDINNMGIHVAMGSNVGDVLIYDLRNFKKPLHSLFDHKGSVNDVAFQPAISKSKKSSIFNITLKDMGNYKNTTPQKLTLKPPDIGNNSDFIDNIVSPLPRNISTNNSKSKDINVSNDSFLAKVVDQSNASQISNYCNDSKLLNSNILKTSDMLSPNLNLHEIREEEENKMASVTTSTPVLSRILGNDTATPSPILKNVTANEFDINGNSDSQKQQTLKKTMDSTDGFTGETIKCDSNYIAELGNELKNYIRFTMYDVLGECRNNYINLTMEQVKSRLFLEDQIGVLMKKMQNLQQTQNILLEENKKLSIELEMLRASKK